MRTYTAHLKPAAPLRLVQEGWSWGAFLFGPLWLLAKRAWIPALIAAAAIAVMLIFLPPALRPPGMFGLLFLLGLLGRDLLRWSLALHGYELHHVLAARDEDGALARLLAVRADLVEQLR